MGVHRFCVQVWLREPTGYIAEHPAADMMISTDCASHDAEMRQTPDVARCGHIPGAPLCLRPPCLAPKLSLGAGYPSLS